jgi:hypothetical protein
LELDEVGTELPDSDAAQAMAASLARRLLSDDDECYWSTTEWSLDVRDEAGRSVANLQIRHGDVVEWPPRESTA